MPMNADTAMIMKRVIGCRRAILGTCVRPKCAMVWDDEGRSCSRIYEVCMFTREIMEQSICGVRIELSDKVSTLYFYAAFSSAAHMAQRLTVGGPLSRPWTPGLDRLPGSPTGRSSLNRSLPAVAPSDLHAKIRIEKSVVSVLLMVLLRPSQQYLNTK